MMNVESNLVEGKVASVYTDEYLLVNLPDYEAKNAENLKDNLSIYRKYVLLFSSDYEFTENDEHFSDFSSKSVKLVEDTVEFFAKAGITVGDIPWNSEDTGEDIGVDSYAVHKVLPNCKSAETFEGTYYDLNTSLHLVEVDGVNMIICFDEGGFTIYVNKGNAETYLANAKEWAKANPELVDEVWGDDYRSAAFD